MRKLNSTNYHNEQTLQMDCPIIATFSELGGRWKIKLLFTLKDRPMRYSELRREIPGISEKMLTVQLRELVIDGWVAKHDYQTIPPHTEYSLSEKGQSFVPVLQQIFQWAMSRRREAVELN